MSDQFPKEYHATSLIESGRKLAVITGSGIDAEAGLPTFRGEKGYYEDQEASYLASMEALQNEPIRQWRWYLKRFVSYHAPHPGNLIGCWQQWKKSWQNNFSD